MNYGERNRDIRIYSSEISDDYRYPPFIKGIPLIKVDEVVSSQADIIDKIKLEIGSQLFPYTKVVIENYADFVHLLPASKDYHHFGAGGLFRHGLEVGLNAVKLARNEIFFHPFPEERQKNTPKWILASFVAGICHDIGKPLSDYAVRTNDKDPHEWNPFVESLHDFVEKKGSDRYFLFWSTGRFKRHENLSSVVADRIIPTDVLAFLATRENEIIESMFGCITNSPSTKNPIFSLVEKADHHSVANDLSRNKSFANPEIIVPLNNYVAETIKKLNVTHGWGDDFNQYPPLMFIDERLFLTSKAVKVVMSEILKLNLPGISDDPNYFVSQLVKSGFFTSFDDASGSGKTMWRVQIGDKRIPAICITEWSSIYNVEPEEKLGATIVFNDEEVSDRKPEEPSKKVSDRKPEESSKKVSDRKPEEPSKTSWEERLRNVDPKLVDLFRKSIEKGLVSKKTGRYMLCWSDLLDSEKDSEIVQRGIKFGVFETYKGNVTTLLNGKNYIVVSSTIGDLLPNLSSLKSQNVAGTSSEKKKPSPRTKKTSSKTTKKSHNHLVTKSDTRPAKSEQPANPPSIKIPVAIEKKIRSISEELSSDVDALFSGEMAAPTFLEKVEAADANLARVLKVILRTNLNG